MSSSPHVSLTRRASHIKVRASTFLDTFCFNENSKKSNLWTSSQVFMFCYQFPEIREALKQSVFSWFVSIRSVGCNYDRGRNIFLERQGGT